MTKLTLKIATISAALVLSLVGCTKSEPAPLPDATVSETSLVVATDGKLASEVSASNFTVAAGDSVHLSVKFGYSDGTKYLVPLTATTWAVTAEAGQVSLISNEFRGFTVGEYTLTATLNLDPKFLAPKTIIKKVKVTAGTPNSVKIVEGDAQTNVVTNQLQKDLKVEVLDLYKNAVSNSKVTFTSNDGQVITSEVITDTNGYASTSYILGIVSGKQTVRAQVGNFVIKYADFNINANPDAPYQLVVRANPETAIAGQPFAKPVLVVTQDKYSNDITTDSRDVTLSAAQDEACLVPGDGTLLVPSPTMTTTNGTGIYPSVAYTKTQDLYLKAEGAAGTLKVGCSTKISMKPNTPSKIEYTTQPFGLLSGPILTKQPVVAVEDYLGNIVTSLNVGTMSLAAFSDTACTVSSPGNLVYTSQPTMGGIVSYTDIAYSKAETISIQASFPYNGKTFTTCSNQMKLGANAASQIAFSIYPNKVTAGTDFSVAVVSRDYLGNNTSKYTKQLTVIPYTDSQCLTVANGVLKLPATLPQFTDGEADITLSYTKSGPLYLKATTEDFSVCSGQITVNPNDPYFLRFVNQPASYNGTIAKFLTYNPQVALQDFYGNTVNSATGVVTIQPYINNGCTDPGIHGAFTGNTVNLLAGVALFTNISYNNTETIYFKATYNETNGTVLNDCSNSATFNPDTTNLKISFSTQPGGSGASLAGQLLPVQPVVSVTDILGNPVSPQGKVSLSAFTDASCVDAFIAPGKLNASPTGITNGLATFNDVYYSQSGKIYLKASYGRQSVCSSLVNVKSASIAQLAFTQYPTSQVKANNPFDNFVIQAQDSFNNLAEIAQGQITLTAYSNNTCTVSASSTLSGGQLNMTDGIANFSNVQYAKSEIIYLKADYNDGTYFVSSPCSTPVYVQPNTFVDMVAVQFPDVTVPIIPGQELVVQPLYKAVDAYGNKVPLNSNVFYNFFSDSKCTIPESGQTMAQGDILNGKTSNAHMNLVNSGANYIQATVITENVSLCLKTPLNVVSKIAIAPKRSDIGSAQTEPLNLTGGGLPYTCAVQPGGVPDGFSSTFSSDCSSFTAGTNATPIPVITVDPSSGEVTNTVVQYAPITQTITVTDAYGQKAVFTFVVWPQMTTTMASTILSGNATSDWTLLNAHGDINCSTSSAIGSTIVGCTNVDGTLRQYIAGFNSSGGLQQESFTVTDSLGQKSSISIDIRPSLKISSNYNPTALSECEAITVLSTENTAFPKTIAVPIFTDRGAFYTTTDCTGAPSPKVTILQGTTQSIIYHKASGVGTATLNFGTGNPDENYFLKIMDLPNLVVNADATFTCSNSGATVTCPASLYNSGGALYTDGIVKMVSSDIPLGTSTIQIADGDVTPFKIGQKLMVITMKTTGSDTSRVGNYEIMRVTGVSAGGPKGSANPATLSISQIKSSSGTSVIQNGTIDYVQILVVPEFNKITINGTPTLTARAWDPTAKMYGVFALTSLKTISANGAVVNMNYKGFYGPFGGRQFGEGISDIDGAGYGGGAPGGWGGTACSYCMGGWGGRGRDGAGGPGGGFSGAGAGGGGGANLSPQSATRLILGAGGSLGGRGGYGGWGANGYCSNCHCWVGAGGGPGYNYHGGGGSGAGGGGSGCNYGGGNGGWGGNGSGLNFDPQDEHGGGIIYINSRNVSGLQLYAKGYGAHQGGTGGQGGDGGGGNGCDSGCSAGAIGAGGGGGGGGGGGAAGGTVSVIAEKLNQFNAYISGGNGGGGGPGGLSGAGGCGCYGPGAWGRGGQGGDGAGGQSGVGAFYFSSMNNTQFTSALSGPNTITTGSVAGFGGQWSSSLWCF